MTNYLESWAAAGHEEEEKRKKEMRSKNKPLWDRRIPDWWSQRICRIFCFIGLHLSRTGYLYGKEGLVYCDHCGTVIIEDTA